MIKKFINYTLLILLLLLILLVALGSFIFYSDTGSRLALRYGIYYADVEVQYDSVKGNLSDGLAFQNLSFQSDAVDVTVEHLSYQSDLTWFNWHLAFDRLQANQVHIKVKASTSPEIHETTEFQGFTLPFPIDINHLQVDGMIIETAPDGVAQLINQIKMTGKLLTDRINIESLYVATKEHQLTTQGEIAFNQALAFQLETNWQSVLDELQLAGQGTVQGDLNGFVIDQQLSVIHPSLKGDFGVKGSLTSPATRPQVDVSVYSKSLITVVNEQQLQLTDFTAKLMGDLSDYHIESSADITGPKISDQSFPDSQIQFKGQGDSTQVSITEAHVITPEGQVDLIGSVNWQQDLLITSQLNIQSFNPQQIFADWPGSINGQASFRMEKADNGLRFESQNNQINGTLKGQEFILSGSATYDNETLITDQLILKLGDNEIDINGQLSAAEVNLQVKLKAAELSLISNDLRGMIVGEVKFSGSQQQPTINTQLLATDISFKQYKAQNISINSAGQWGQQLATELQASAVQLNNQLLDSLSIKQTGWLNEHQLELTFTTAEVESNLVLNGHLKNRKGQDIVDFELIDQQTEWQGQLQSHVIQVYAEQKVELQKPINIKVADAISIEPGCWRGVATGLFCFELNDIDQSEVYQGKVTLEDFSLVPFEIFYPNNLMIKGKARGHAEFKVESDNLYVTADLSLIEGQLLVTGTDDNDYRADIQTMMLHASTSQDLVEMTLLTELSDGSNFKINAVIDDFNQGDWGIDSSIKGVFKNTEFIAQLTEEISDMQGQLIIDGTIKGLLKSPQVELKLTQPEGFLQSTRLGTLIEKTEIKVSTTNTQNPIYQLSFSGINVPSSNEGTIAAQGQLTLVNGGWQFDGELSGDNFMVINLPQAKFNVSPKLSIKANQEQMDLEGVFLLDSGHVVVKQLPASTVNNSPDLVIQQAEQESSMVYQISLDIKANIKDFIELDVIGLNAKLTGGVELKQALNEQIKAFGTMNLVDGTYEIYGQSLKIVEGELIFTGLIDNPRIKVKASRTSISGEVVAGVELGGSVTNLKSKLYSEPEMPDIEKLAYIMTGRGLDNSNSLSADQLKQTAIIMGLNQSSPIFSQIQNQFGIDVFTIKEGADKADTVVEAGKKINDRLYVSYNQGLFNRLGYWVLKYRINKYLNLQSTQGEDQSVELVYTRKAEIKKETQ